MAHTVYLGSFGKKLNSTAQPAYTSWSSYSCVFKEETSINTPTIRLSAGFTSFTSNNYNYAVMLGRYYWINDIRAVRNNYVEIDLTLDALATYRSNILSTSAYIEYGFNSFDASDSSNRVADTRQPISRNPVMSTADFDPSGGMIDALDGCYIVQAVGNDPNGAHKGLASFCLSAAYMHQLITVVNRDIKQDIADIISNPNALTPQDIANQLMQFDLENALVNESAIAAIQSVIWLPFDIASASGTGFTELYLGNYDTGINGLMLTQNDIYSHLSAVTIPWGTISDWKRNNAQMLLYLPFFGTIPIPIDQSIDTSALGISWTAEYFSGSISVIVRSGDGAYTIYAGSTNVGVNMGVGRSAVGASNLIGGTIQALGGALQMAGGAIDIGTSVIGSALGLSSFASAASGITAGASNMFSGYAQTIQPVITCTGTMGGMAAIGQTQPGRLCLIYFPPLDDAGFRAKYGHPVFKVTTPTSGFCKTKGFSISLPSNSTYAALINSAMDGGVYIE